MGRPCGGGFEYLHRSPAIRRRRQKVEPGAWGHIWVNLFLGDINTGTWPSRLGESRIWDSKMWSWVPRDSGPRMTAVARASSNCKQQTRPLVREGALHEETHYCLTVKESGLAPQMGAWHQDRLTVGRNINLLWHQTRRWQLLCLPKCRKTFNILSVVLQKANCNLSYSSYKLITKRNAVCK
jgi:hypothetical protein